MLKTVQRLLQIFDEIVHVYLHGATVLRPDLHAKQQAAKAAVSNGTHGGKDS